MRDVQDVILEPFGRDFNLTHFHRPGLFEKADPEGLTNTLVEAFRDNASFWGRAISETARAGIADIEELETVRSRLNIEQSRALDIVRDDYNQWRDAISNIPQSQVFFRLQEPGYQSRDEEWHFDTGVERRALIRYSGHGVQQVHRDDVLSIKSFDIEIRDNPRLITIPNGDAVAQKAQKLFSIGIGLTPPFFYKTSIPAIHRKQPSDKPSLVLVAHTLKVR